MEKHHTYHNDGRDIVKGAFASRNQLISYPSIQSGELSKSQMPAHAQKSAFVEGDRAKRRRETHVRRVGVEKKNGTADERVKTLSTRLPPHRHHLELHQHRALHPPRQVRPPFP